MQLPLAGSIAPRLDWLSSAASTNDELVSRATGPARSEWPHLSVVATDDQRRGRGRLDRDWVTPPGTALAASVLVRPSMPVVTYGWLPLIAGASMTRALRSLGAAASMKWPNDVLIGEKKVCGILSELLPDLSGAVVGAGVNIDMAAEDLPVVTATSLAVEGVRATVDEVLGRFLGEFRTELELLDASAGDADASGARERVEAVCSTLGRAVRVILPTGRDVLGEATGLDSSGRLMVAVADSGGTFAVSAGEVTHLRY
jgi:BirA family biotin operon repressor/biotin-[acetyl-CoA-carboxylase] ligase